MDKNTFSGERENTRILLVCTVSGQVAERFHTHHAFLDDNLFFSSDLLRSCVMRDVTFQRLMKKKVKKESEGISNVHTSVCFFFTCSFYFCLLSLLGSFTHTACDIIKQAAAYNNQHSRHVPEI